MTTLMLMVLAAGQEPQFVDTFNPEDYEFSSTGRNPYFILEPGFTLVLEGEEDGEGIELIITVLDETIEVDGVECRIVEERESEGGELIEVSRNFFAIDARTNSVFYFGEDVDMYRNGEVVNHHGAWRSGVDGARFGMMMPGSPEVGQAYYQEIAPGEAMDRARVISVTDTFETPSGTYENCLRTEETTPLEPREREHKIYAPGIGLLRDGACRLIRVEGE